MSSAAAKTASPANANQPVKDLYEIGEIPPLGHVPEKMYAWCIRQERHGAPDTAMQVEVVPTWSMVRPVASARMAMALMLPSLPWSVAMPKVV